MGAGREMDQADFDFGRFIDMFDQAMTSRDPRVTDALRSLMLMVILTKPEVDANPAVDRERGPLRRMYDDLGNLSRRMSRVEEEIRHTQQSTYSYKWDGFDRYPNERYATMQDAARVDQKILDNLKIQINQIKKSGL